MWYLFIYRMLLLHVIFNVNVFLHIVTVRTLVPLRIGFDHSFDEYAEFKLGLCVKFFRP